MLTQPVRFARLRSAVIVFTVIAIAVGAAMVGWGIYRGLRSESFALEALMPMAAGALAIASAVAVLAFVWLLVKIESNSHRQYNQLRELCDRIAQQSKVLSAIAGNTQISDAARGIAHRDQEREAVRNAIREEMARADWEAALYLIDLMEQRFGYQEEAERLKHQVIDARTADMRDRLNEALGRIEALWEVHDWDRAKQEIDRLVHALPDDRRTVSLHADHDTRREAHKRELLAAWERASKQGDMDEGDVDVDSAIMILKDLDQYVTREEAQTLEESARGVFKAKLVQLGMQFEYAVKDHRWCDAIEVGLQINEEFPNSRMAEQVREMHDVLRQRAGLTADVEITAQSTTPPAGS